MKNKYPLPAAAVIILTLAVVALNSQNIYSQAAFITSDVTNPQPINLDFEKGTAGALPLGWVSPTAKRGYIAELTGENAKTGTRAAILRSPSEGSTDAHSFGNLMQAFDATPYRGHAVRFRAAVRVEVPDEDSNAQLWMRADRAGGKWGFFGSMDDHPTRSDKWGYFEIVGQIDADAEKVNIGMILVGSGKAWIDDVTVTDLGKVNTVEEKPRPLTRRGLDNIIAFSHLLGYIRHFYPGDEAVGANWDALAVEGVRAVENANSPKALAKGLEDFFKPVAPDLKVFVTTSKANAATMLPVPGNYEALKLTSYKHTGWGRGKADSPYHTERPVKPVAEITEKDRNNIQRPFVADLGGGVSCIFPLALFTDEKGTLPKGIYRRDPDKEVLVNYSGNDRATRLADVALAWNVLQHFYPYFDVVKVDWSRALRETLTSAAVDANDLAFLDTMRRMIAKLQDGHGGVYYPGEENRFRLPVIFDWIEGHLVVVNAIPEKSEGIRPGDVVLSIDEKLVSSVMSEREALVSGATPQWKRRRVMDQLRMGAKDSEIHLLIQTGSDAARTVTLRRGPGNDELSEVRPPKIDEIKPDVFYVDLDRIHDADFTSALPKLAKAKGIIFDLRGYPRVSPMVISHLIGEPVQSARWMAPILTAPDRTGKIEYNTDGRWNLKPEAPRLTAKIAFLTDGRAISYAESYMGIIEAYHLASIVGETTAGTNGDVNPFDLPGGYTVVWTGLKVLKHDGTQHHGVGIKPTVPVSRTIRGIASGKDEQLDAAVSLVSQ